MQKVVHLNWKFTILIIYYLHCTVLLILFLFSLYVKCFLFSIEVFFFCLYFGRTVLILFLTQTMPDQ